MKLRYHSSLRVKVVAVILLNCAIALSIAAAAFVAYSYSNLRSRTVSRLEALVGVVGENSKAALVFKDRKAAEGTLSSLVADPRILAAAIYDADGELFARYLQSAAVVSFPAPPPSAFHEFSADRISLYRPLQADGQKIGTIYVVADLQAFASQIQQFIRTGVAVFALALIASAVLALLLHRLVADPVLELAGAVQAVAKRGDYTVRVPLASRDELGHLAGSFNEMLDQIELRDSALRASEARYARAVEGAGAGLWDWDLRSGRIYYSPRWIEMLGFTESELQPDPFEWLKRIHPAEAQEVRAALDAHLAGASPHFEVECRLQHKGGGWIWVQSRGVAVRDATGAPIRLTGSQADVTALKGRDELTGLPNRVLLSDRLESALRRALRDRERQFAVVAIGVEKLSLINETLGRSAARTFLLAAADRIQEALGQRGTLARLEGDKFAILLEESGDANEAARIADAALAALRPAFHVEEQEIFIRAAAGIALSLSGYERPEQILNDAEAALSRAREASASPIEVFDLGIREQALARLAIENDLRRAVENGQLELHYQPIVALAGRQRLAAFEALVRWPRAGSVLSQPEDFIQLAEETGIIVPLGSWVLREACRQLKLWHAEGSDAAALGVSVNVSARQINNGDFLGEIEAALGDSGLPADRLKLEITESLFVERLEPDGDLIRGLRRLGVGLWLDDFGSGYSNLSYLHRLPIEALKIDRGFVTTVDVESESQAIFGTLLELARKLGLKSVAEGVETASQLRKLEAIGCDLVQGFAISQPLDADAVGAMLRRESLLQV